MKILLTLLLLFLALSGTAQAEDAPTADAEAAYTRTIDERAAKIVTPLGLADSAQAARVRDLIAGQYRALRDLHAARDTKIGAVKKQANADKAVIEAGIQTASNEAQSKLDALHKSYIARLLAELTPEQVDTVKDGMTYGVAPLTYGVYLEMLPDLKAEQKRQIRAWLLEAREYAMDAGTAQEKHGWFGKYKGRINNYLAAAGYDLKKAEQDLAARRKTAEATKN